MTTDDKVKVPFTLRMKKDLSDRIQYEANQLGISKAAYINMVLHQSFRTKNK
ncbi:hypothetical protein [Niallia sp. RD1]|uniref:hypothetical protein n=1 Tax=Niallia sp. RD1 TaxID=2962858 RepID=UPI0020C1A7AB|nr:hypothetical protein [Niallia sp. RD1]UTI41087.1 hypothetical protein NKG37_19820 [Niallia sp. RD1]